MTDNNNQLQGSIPSDSAIPDIPQNAAQQLRQAQDEIQRLNECLAGKDHHIAGLDDRLASKDHQIAFLDQSLQAVHLLSQELRTEQADRDKEIQVLRAALAASRARERACGCITGTTDGVVVVLPHVTRTFSIVFDVYREYWTRYDLRRPPKSSAIARTLDERLGWSSGGSREPSRSAQSFAAAMRPDALGEADGRNQKRRQRSGILRRNV